MDLLYKAMRLILCIAVEPRSPKSMAQALSRVPWQITKIHIGKKGQHRYAKSENGEEEAEVL